MKDQYLFVFLCLRAHSLLLSLCPSLSLCLSRSLSSSLFTTDVVCSPRFLLRHSGVGSIHVGLGAPATAAAGCGCQLVRVPAFMGSATTPVQDGAAGNFHGARAGPLPGRRHCAHEQRHNVSCL